MLEGTEGWSTRMIIFFVDRYSHNRRWKAWHGCPLSRNISARMEANSSLHNFLSYLDPVTQGKADEHWTTSIA